jgi:hypothetical protein
MAEPVARIRPFQASDDKVVRFAIGKANMESLAVANRRGKSDLSCSLHSTCSIPISPRLYSPVHDWYFPCVILHVRTFHGYVADERPRLPRLPSTLPPDSCSGCSNYGFH